MNILKNKLALLSPILALGVIFIFSLTLFPSVQIQPKSLPIAVANLDEGVTLPNQSQMNFGQTIVDTIQKSSAATSDEEPAVKWIQASSMEEIQQGLNEQKYYAALVIPADFSQKQASLSSTSPVSPEIQIDINQGMNTAASTAAGQILNGVVDNINNNVRSQILAQFKAQGATLTVEQASSLANPITRNVVTVNAAGANTANGNSPVSLFQPLWMASLVSAAVLVLAVNKTAVFSRKEAFTVKLLQIITGAVVAVVAGFGLTWLAKSMVGLHIPQFTDTALFLALTCFSFYLMISAVLSIVGIKGISVFALLLFFGAPLLSLAPEMMPSFYRDWVHPWLPMRFMVDGLRKLFFFNEGFTWNSAVATLTWIGLVSIIVIFVTALKPQNVRGRHKLAV